MAMKKEILQVLANNIHANPTPGIVNSESIAKQLNAKISEVFDVLNQMAEEMGLIICSVDNQYTIITRDGLNYLNEHSQIQPKGIKYNETLQSNGTRGHTI